MFNNNSPAVDTVPNIKISDTDMISVDVNLLMTVIPHKDCTPFFLIEDGFLNL